MNSINSHLNLSKESFNEIFNNKTCQNLFNKLTPEELTVYLYLVIEESKNHINNFISNEHEFCNIITDLPCGCDVCFCNDTINEELNCCKVDSDIFDAKCSLEWFDELFNI